MTKTLVIGGAGFIGSHIVRRQLHMGRAVTVLDDLSSGYRHNLAEVGSDIELIEGTICDLETVRRVSKGADTIFHLAARASVPRSVAEPINTNDVNTNGTLNVLVAARDNEVRRVVNSASSSAYGETPQLPKTETILPQPLSPYAVSKLAAEYYCAAFSECYGLGTVSLRYFNVFGPRQDPAGEYAAVIPAFVAAMLGGKRPLVYGDGEQSRDFCFVENVVNANCLAAEADGLRGQAVNIACGERTTLNEMIAVINNSLGTNLAPDYQPERTGDIKHSLADLSLAEQLIGYRPKIMFAEGLARSIEWYRENL
jgi:nucleoside-diphosphate-sugar epimerase